MDCSDWCSPETHLPERWLRGGAGNTTHPFLLTPFGHGTRMCAGRRFAEQDLYCLLARYCLLSCPALHRLLYRLVAQFRLQYSTQQEGREMGQVYNTLLFPDRPLTVQFLDR